MKLIAHRGYKTKNIKENTIEAFTNAYNNDFCGIECDVRKTKDDVLVICHDFFIDRVSDGSGLLSSYTYKDLLKFNFGSKEEPAQIPRLVDVLKRYKGVKLVELKTHIDMENVIPYVDENTYFMSFDTSYILELKNKYPNLKFGVLNYVLNSISNYNLDMICLLDDVATDNLVDFFLNKGIVVFIYGISDEIKYRRENENIYYIVNKKY